MDEIPGSATCAGTCGCANGNAAHLSYDSRDRLAAVLDDAGRGVLLTYGDCGLLERVSDHTGTRIVEYWHDGDIEGM